MPRQPKPDHNGQGILPGCAHYRPKSRRVNGKRRNDETLLYAAIQEVMDARPGIVARAWRNNSGLAVLRRGGALALAPKGSPDFVGFLVDGRFLGIEVKLEGEELRPDQDEWRELIQASGGVHLVVRSREECAAALEAIVLLGAPR